MGLWEILLSVLLGLSVLCYYFTNTFDTWKKLKIDGPKPISVFGNLKEVILGKIHLADYIKSVYDMYKFEPVVGVFASKIPFLIVRDPETIQEILIKSFPNFGDRGGHVYEDVDPLSQHLLYMTAEKWKPMRQKLSPVFTSTKLQGMFYLISDCAENLTHYIENSIAKDKIVDCLELTSKFTMNVIGDCVFGLNTNVFSKENNEFERIGKMSCEHNVQNLIKRLVKYSPHWLAKLMKPIIKNDYKVNFFVDIMEKNMEFRKKNNIRRNDFVDLLMNIKDHPETVGKEDMTIVQLTAQAYVFFVAGFDTTSSTITHALYEMALNPIIQDKLRKEINIIMEKNNGKLNYDDIENMKYLDQIFKETLRKYPPGYFTARKSANDYTFSSIKIAIPKDTKIIIPISALHYDPNYFQEPDKFYPERFNEESEKTRHPMTYIPFGAGPRKCIGDRFAYVTSKVGLVKMINRFKFEVCEKTCIPYEKAIGRFLLSPKDGLFLKIKDV